MTTECKTASAGTARPEMTRLEAVDQIASALEEVAAVLNLLCNDHIDCRPNSGIETTEQALKLVGSLLGTAWSAHNEFQPFAGVDSAQFSSHLDRLWSLVLLLENNASNTPDERVLVALALVLRLADGLCATFAQCLEGNGNANSQTA